MMGQKKGPAVTIQTLAYNVEKYIVECAESVLNQRFTDFEWVVLDNGSTDRTGEILLEYAKKDSRVKLFKNEKNSYIYNIPFNSKFMEYYENLQSEYWCVLDSDDFLHPDFLSELYRLAKRHDVDIAIGGTLMFREEDMTKRATRCPPDFFMGDITQLGDIFPEVYGVFRPMWGKLFKTSLVHQQRDFRKKQPINLKNGGDTVFCLDCLNLANSIVATNQALHYYRIRQDSLYHSQVDSNRYNDYQIIYHEGKKLLQNWDKLTPKNENFLARVFYVSIKECMEIIAKSTLPAEEKFNMIELILSDSSLYETFNKAGLLNDLLEDTINIVQEITNQLEESDFPKIIRHYTYKLFSSIHLLESLPSQKKNAFLLYLAAICDERNTNRFGTPIFSGMLTQCGFTDLVQIEQQGIPLETLAKYPLFLREIVNSQWGRAIAVCEQYVEHTEYPLLKEVLQQMKSSVDMETISSAKRKIFEYGTDDISEESIDSLVYVLENCPLDKEALAFKLRLFKEHDMYTALETAEVLRVMYPDDRDVLKEVEHTYQIYGM